MYDFIWEIVGERRELHLADRSHIGIHKMHVHTPQTSSSYLTSLRVMSHSHPNLIW